MALYTEQEVREMIKANQKGGCFSGLISLIIKVVIAGIIAIVIVAIASN